MATGVVVEIIGSSVVDGFLLVHTKPSSHEAAELLAGHRLDRRHNYAVHRGTVYVRVGWETSCVHCRATGLPRCRLCSRPGVTRNAEWALPVDAQLIDDGLLK